MSQKLDVRDQSQQVTNLESWDALLDAAIKQWQMKTEKTFPQQSMHTQN
jgi:hypothetical protein